MADSPGSFTMRCHCGQHIQIPIHTTTLPATGTYVPVNVEIVMDAFKPLIVEHYDTTGCNMDVGYGPLLVPA